MAASRHEKTVGDFLRTNASFTGTVDVFNGPFREGMLDDSPDGVATVISTGGTPGHMQGGQGSESAKEVSLQVMMVAPGHAYATGSDNANEIWNTLQHAQPSGTGGIWCEQAAPLSVGTDDDGRHRFTVNLRMLVTE